MEKILDNCGWSRPGIYRNRYPTLTEYNLLLTRSLALIKNIFGTDHPFYKSLIEHNNKHGIEKYGTPKYYIYIYNITKNAYMTYKEMIKEELVEGNGLEKSKRGKLILSKFQTGKLNLEAYNELYIVENKLRDFIGDKLRSIDWDKWIEKGISKEIIKKASKYKNKVGKYFSSIEYNFPLDYLDFPFYHHILENNLYQIINNKDSKTIENLKKKLADFFTPLDEFRIAIAHCIKISKDDLERFKINIEMILNFLNKFKKMNNKQVSKIKVKENIDKYLPEKLWRNNLIINVLSVLDIMKIPNFHNTFIAFLYLVLSRCTCYSAESKPNVLQ